MPNKSHIYLALLTLIFVLAPLLLPAAADDNDNNNTNASSPQQQPVQLVSRERALSVLGSVNGTILFVDMQIAIAERERKDVVAAVANLASARRTLKEAVAAFDGGDYVWAVELSNEASVKAQHALVAIPPTPQTPVSQPTGVTFEQASRALKSANETVMFVDEKIAEAERARRNVIRPVETLAEARGLVRQASGAFEGNDYAKVQSLASEAIGKAQWALAILSEAKQAEVLDLRTIAISGTALILIALVLYFGPIRRLAAAATPKVQPSYQYYYYPPRPPSQPYYYRQRPPTSAAQPAQYARQGRVQSIRPRPAPQQAQQQQQQQPSFQQTKVPSMWQQKYLPRTPRQYPQLPEAQSPPPFRQEQQRQKKPQQPR